jgi:REP element-mobilizing transposase RayT
VCCWGFVAPTPVADIASHFADSDAEHARIGFPVAKEQSLTAVQSSTFNDHTSLPIFRNHVVQQGVRRMDVFFSADDRQKPPLLSQSAWKCAIDFLAWCLMSHHVHFVVVPRQERSLARTFGEAHRKYTRMVNFREGWRGSLWQQSFHSYPMGERRASENIGLIFSSWPLPFG